MTTARMTGFWRGWLTAALPLTVLLLSGPSQAADNRLDKILGDKQLRVGTTGDYKPFSFLDPAKGSFEGADIDMAADLAKSLGAELKLVKTSWSTMMDDLLADKFDIAMGGVSVSLERQKRADFSIAYLTDGKAAIARCADVAKYRTLDGIDRPETRAIVNPGGTNERFARAMFKQAPITVYPDNVTIFDQIAAGKADVMVTDSSETRFQQKLHPGVLCAANPDDPFNFSEKAFLFQRDVVWKAYVDQWLRQAIMSKQLKAVLEKWLG